MPVKLIYIPEFSIGIKSKVAKTNKLGTLDPIHLNRVFFILSQNLQGFKSHNEHSYTEARNRWSKEIEPVNNLKDVGKVLLGLTQKTSDLVDEYSPGSIIKGIARLSLQNTMEHSLLSSSV